MVVLWVYSAHLRCLFPQHGTARNTNGPLRSKRGSRTSSTGHRGRSSEGASAPTAACSSTALGRTSTSATTSRTSRKTSSISSSPPVITSVCDPADTRSGAVCIDARTWPRSWNESASRPERHAVPSRRSAAVAEWQTRRPQVPVGATPWRFESSQPHGPGALSGTLALGRRSPPRSRSRARPRRHPRAPSPGSRRPSPLWSSPVLAHP